ncbi:type II toxin-antitoxin system HicB family antitoxin [Halolamina sp. CBA1230]|uniref:type II toxin-antitoxin system HicB family antitoxin n=1 Tax=Halolamina sp. CBA1230 TaxID=1853690 RepID=UPI0009A2429C|nr:type II toxin-antitoxin system HicB family antitoxin [Halolamina sp. CBA1230]QKY20246.1 type II toxin-antitoxin system HicB family antitoxin [Halolamina sp. CBA1230]
MSTDTPNDGSATDDPASRNISLSWNEDAENWSAVDEDLGVASVGDTREEALAMLDEAVALHTGEAGQSIDSWEEEKEVLEDLGIDPDEVKEARDSDTELPDFMR